MNKEDTMAIAKRAHGSKCADKWPTLEADKFTYEATMERIIGNIQEKAHKPKHMTKPLWEKYKYFSHGSDRRDADYHQQEQDHLHTFKYIDMPVPTKVTMTKQPVRSSSAMDVVEQATRKLQKERRPKRAPQKSPSEGSLGSAAAFLAEKGGSPTRPKKDLSKGVIA